MIIYEVNLTIDNQIFDDYYNWLTPHCKQMLTFPGFKQVNILKEQSDTDGDQTRITCTYLLEDQQSLDNYITNHSTSMRDDGIKRFGNKFSAKRRIFEVLNTY